MKNTSNWRPIGGAVLVIMAVGLLWSLPSERVILGFWFAGLLLAAIFSGVFLREFTPLWLLAVLALMGAIFALTGKLAALMPHPGGFVSQRFAYYAALAVLIGLTWGPLGARLLTRRRHPEVKPSWRHAIKKRVNLLIMAAAPILLWFAPTTGIWSREMLTIIFWGTLFLAGAVNLVDGDGDLKERYRGERRIVVAVMVVVVWAVSFVLLWHTFRPILDQISSTPSAVLALTPQLFVRVAIDMAVGGMIIGSVLRLPVFVLLIKGLCQR